MACMLILCFYNCSVGQQTAGPAVPPAATRGPAANCSSGRSEADGVREGPHSSDQMTSLLQLMFSGAQTQGEGPPLLVPQGCCRTSYCGGRGGVCTQCVCTRGCMQQSRAWKKKEVCAHKNAQFLSFFFLSFFFLRWRSTVHLSYSPCLPLLFFFAPFFLLPHLPPLTCLFSSLFSLSLTPSPPLFLLSLCSAAR